MKCQNCGADLATGVAFCRECGAKVVQKKRFCRECGSELVEGAKFCSNCGASVAINTEQEDDSFQTFNAEPTASRIKKPDFSMLSEAKTRFSDVGQSIKASVQESFNTGKSSQMSEKSWIVLSILVAVAFFLLLLSLLLHSVISKSNSSNEVSNSEVSIVSTTFDEITPDVSVAAAIEPGTEYAFMVDAWDVYIARAVSSNVIKVESWYKSLQPDKEMKLRGVLGSYKIDDEANGFSWVDDEHMAFTLTIQDKNNSELKQPTAVIFTINVSDSDADKGTDYDKEIACYEYVNDDWHTYRAIALSDHLIKIECWYRTSSAFWESHRFGWDVGLIDTENTSTDFEWGDEQHNAFTITMIDPANDSYWKEKKLTSFILADEEYKYPTVLSFLEKTSEDEALNSVEKTEVESAETSSQEVIESETNKVSDSQTVEETEAVSYSTNTKATVKNGDAGVYSYKSRGGSYDIYYIIDFDEGYVYFFCEGNGDTTCDRIKIDSGTLNDVVIITYHDGSDTWQQGFHFKWSKQPDHLIMEDHSGFEYDYYTTDLSEALALRDTKTIYDY